MIKGSEVRKPDHQIEKLLIDRWSPRAMSGEEISQEEVMRLFEAARWAPSSFNTQQWRALYHAATRNIDRPSSICWLTGTKRGQKNATVLVVFISCKLFDHDNEPSVTHSYDCGAAWENFALQGFSRAWSCTGCKDSITIARANNCGFPMNSKSKRSRSSGGTFTNLGRSKESIPRAWQVFKSDPFHPSLGSHEIYELTARAKHTIYAAVIPD